MNGERPSKKRELPKIAYIVLLTTVPVIWGYGFVATDDALKGGIDALGTLAFRFLLAALVLFAFRLFLPNRTEYKEKFTRKDWIRGAVLGTVNFFGFFLQTVGLKYTDPARSGMLTGTYVVLVPLVSLAIYKKFNLRSIVNAVIFFIGMLFLVDFKGSSGTLYGDALCLLCSVFFCAQILLTDRLCVGLNLINFNAVQMLTMGTLGLFGTLLFERDTFAAIGFGQVILPLLYLGLFSSAYAYIVQTFAQRKLSASLTAILLSLESVTSVLFSLAFGRTQFSLSLAIGCVIMAAASVFASVFDKKSELKGEKS